MSLTNADFRSLLNTADNCMIGHPSSQNYKKKSKFEEELKRERRKQKYLRLQKSQNTKKDGDEIEEGGYRDRASERRKGNDEFYQQVAEELSEMKSRSIEESKFLGGDIEHTHLVKGLDFALLSKIRSELEKCAQDEKFKEEKEDRIAAANRLQLHSILGRKVFREMYEELHPHSTLFSHKLNKIQNYILKSEGLKSKDNGQNNKWGRMVYIFNLEFNRSSDDIPVLQLNSRVFCPKSKTDADENNHSFVPYIQQHLLNELTKVTEWHLANRKKKKSERLLRRIEATTSFLVGRPAKCAEENEQKNSIFPKHTKPDIADEDIFMGAGGLQISDLIKEEEERQDANDDKKMKKKDKGRASIDANNEKAKEFVDKAKVPIREDIIREEEGMDVEDDDNSNAIPNDWNSHTITQANGYHNMLPVVDGAPVVYGMDMYAYEAHMANMRQSANYQSKSHVDTNATPYVSTEPPKIIKSGTTTIDQDKGFYSVFKRDETAFKKRGREDEREKDPSYISETYMECYPGFGADVSFEAYDSDDQEDRSKMDMGRQKQYGAKHKHQFKSEHDWEKYQLGKEALPKAAFQYGRKMDDNRVTRRRKKLNPEQEWKKIEKLIGGSKKAEDRLIDD